LLLLIAVVAIAYLPPSWPHLLAVALLILVFVSDGLDGYVARKRNEESLFGAMFDIAGDRIVELTMWIVLADLEIVPVWVPLVFVIRGTIVDTIRAVQATSRQQSPFAMMKAPLGRWLVAGGFMRGFYAVLKAWVFCWLLLLQPLPVLVPDFWRQWSTMMTAVGAASVYLTVVVCLLRGLPVVAEFVYSQKEDLFKISRAKR
jgi:CDP-diacylglycerol--glycerol-3-phosphate 3-phosphatidyltransferase